VPSRKEIQWSQLRVGALVVVAMAVLVGLIFLMSGSTGGLFAKKLYLRCYFKNAAGLKDGAPVTLEGVTIGNVRHIRVIPERQPSPVEVTMEVGREYMIGLHTDSTAGIAQAGVLGDSFVDIDSTRAVGPPPADHAELKAAGSPTIQDVIQSSQTSIEQIQVTLNKVNKLLDSVNSGRGTIGKLINDPALAQKFIVVASNLQTITDAIAQGKGSAGKLVMDDTLYQHANSAVQKLDQITTELSEGKGSAGKLLKDEALYNNLNETLASTKELVGEINAGKGALGKLAKDPVFAEKMTDTVTNLDAILKGIHEGQGTMGQLFTNKALYDNLNDTLTNTRNLLDAFRANPKKYLTVQLKLF
jgi:phospholipid/cholesterol/gamma-HCH transport system substrate-binding protein